MAQRQHAVTYLLLFLGLQFLSSNQVLASDVQQRVIGYYPVYSHNETCGMEFDDVPAQNLTHLNFAFGYINNQTFEIEPKEGFDPSLFANFTAIRKRNPDLKMMIALAQPASNITSVFSNITSSSENRQIFIERLICFMRRYCFDGVDFDWEFPGDPSTGGTDDDRPNYTLLLKELNETLAQIPKDFVVSFTAPTPTYYLEKYDWANMMQYVSFMNFMAYDIHNANWGSDKHIYAHTNLTEIKDSLDFLTQNKSVDPGQINLGLAFYGNSYTLADTSCTEPGCPFSAAGLGGPCSEAGVLTYSDTMAVIEEKALTPTWDTTAAIKYINWDNDQWVAYDDGDTFQQKIQFANNQSLSGVFIWAIEQDDKSRSALRGVLPLP